MIKYFFSSIPAIDLLSDSTGTDMVMMTIKNFDFLDNEIEEYDVCTFHSSVTLVAPSQKYCSFQTACASWQISSSSFMQIL